MNESNNIENLNMSNTTNKEVQMPKLELCYINQKIYD